MCTKVEAQVALSKCQEGKKIFGVRMEKTPIGWKYNWAFKISDKRAGKEGYDNTKIIGDIYADAQYPGCPYCKGTSFVVCGTCGRLNCNNTKGRVFTCEWCGAQGELINYDGAGINSAGDI